MTALKLSTNNTNNCGVTLTKKVEDLHDNNFKSLNKNMKKIPKDEKISHAHGSVGLT